MTVKLTPEYIESLIDAEEYLLQPEIIICKLTVGESVFVGEAHCFDIAVQNVTRGKESARRNAISRIFDAEAYHLKRERDKLNRKHGIHVLPIYEVVRKQGGCIRLTNVVSNENYPNQDTYSFTIVDAHGGTIDKSIVVNRYLNEGVDVQLQRELRILCLKGQLEDTESPKSTGMGRNYAEQSGEGVPVINLNMGDNAYKLPDDLITAVNLTGSNEMVSPSEYEGDGKFSGSGASGTWDDKETVQATVCESTTSHHDHHTHNQSNHSSHSEDHSSNDSGGSCSSD